MNLPDTFPVTNKSLKPFRKDFGKKIPSTYKQANWKGRLYCCIQLACSPLTIPLKIVSKVNRIAGLATVLMLAIIKRAEQTLKIKHTAKNWDKERQVVLKITDCLLALALCPITIGASRLRYFVGIINPAKAFPTK
ncbi:MULTISPECIES: hypothetical protein [unclassified Neochlamydia]|uniref:hypothetical protein n=1 Tax=unclassified Neochlamydia TaxID=2643326 RepID=UPI00140916FB|nr:MULTISPECIES: hypothetical protein [unclassified Neochlamydia]MBS4169513.1 Uncharacterized protein [Neochlamydia sp. AcF95]NGY95468.1 hypothetical protein [Neochlamydia sp. AcF84]